MSTMTPPWGDGPMPLTMFSAEKQREIAEAVAKPKPPPRWIGLGMAQITSRAWMEWHRARGREPFTARPKIPQALRRIVIKRDGLVCGLCGGDVEPNDVHVDHIVPLSLGGPTTEANLQVAHARCNMSKGNRA